MNLKLNEATCKVLINREGASSNAKHWGVILRELTFVAIFKSIFL